MHVLNNSWRGRNDVARQPAGRQILWRVPAKIPRVERGLVLTNFNNTRARTHTHTHTHTHRFGLKEYRSEQNRRLWYSAQASEKSNVYVRVLLRGTEVPVHPGR